MNLEQLRAAQGPLKDRYRADPAAAMITMHATGKLGPNITCEIVREGPSPTRVGLHRAAGGDGSGACSGDMMLEALVGCAGVTLGAVATAMGLSIRSGTLKAEGVADFRGTLGVSKDVPVGFQSIRLMVTLETDATDDQLASLLKLTERYCVVNQSLATPATMTIVRAS